MSSAAARRRVFQSVFPPFSQSTVPTPSATPQLGSSQFGGFSSFSDFEGPLDDEDNVAEKIKWERAWHSATAFLTLPPVSVSVENDFEAESRIRQSRKKFPPELSWSLAYLVSEQSPGRLRRSDNREDNLFDWYAQEVERNYIRYQLPQLLQVWV